MRLNKNPAQKISELTIFLSIFLVVFGFSIKTYDVFLSTKEAFFAITLLALLVVLFFTRDKWLEKRTFFLSIGIAIFLLLSLCINNVDFFLIKKFMLPVVIFLVYINILFGFSKDKKKSETFIFIVLLIHFLYSLSQAAGLDFKFWAGWEGRGRIFTTIGNPNFSSIFNGVFAILILYKALQRHNIFLAILSFLPLGTVMLAGSRGVILSTFLAMLMLLLQKKNLKYFLALALFSLLMLLLRPDIAFRLKSSAYFRGGSVENRLIIYNITLNKILEKPFLGYGFEMFQMNYLDAQGEYFEHLPLREKRKSTDAKHTHNEYLQLLYETGVIGFAVFLTILLALYRTLDNRLWKYLLLVFLGQAFFSFPLHVISHIVFFFFLLSFQKPSKNFRANNILWLILAGFVLFSIKDTITYYQSNILLRNGLKSPYSDMLIRAFQLNDKDGIPSAMLGLRYVNRKEYHLAKPYLLSSIRKLKDAQNYNNLAIAYENLGNYTLAEHYYKKGIYVMPSSLLIYNNLVSLYEKLDKEKAFQTLIKRMKLIFSDKGDAFLYSGNHYIKKKNYDAAIKEYTKGLSIEQNNLKLLYNIGVAYYYKGMNKKALFYFYKVRKIAPNYPGIEKTIRIIESKL